MVHMAPKRAVSRARKRFSVTLNSKSYAKLVSLGASQQPKLSLQYIAAYAIERLLRDAEDPQFVLDLRNPIKTRFDEKK
jgi:hypothetical protein